MFGMIEPTQEPTCKPDTWGTQLWRALAP